MALSSWNHLMNKSTPWKNLSTIPASLHGLAESLPNAITSSSSLQIRTDSEHQVFRKKPSGRHKTRCSRPSGRRVLRLKKYLLIVHSDVRTNLRANREQRCWKSSLQRSTI